MTSQLVALCFDANDPVGLARFWSGVLGWEMADDPQAGITLLPADDTGFRIRFVPTQEQKSGPNQMHFDLTSGSLEEQRQTVARALALVWDQDEETAIRSPYGGPKITWGRSVPDAEDREVPAALRPRPTGGRRPTGRGRPSRLPRRDARRHRPGRGRLGGAGRPRRPRVLRADPPVGRPLPCADSESPGRVAGALEVNVGAAVRLRPATASRS